MNPRSLCDEFEYVQFHIFLATAMPLVHCHSTAIYLLCLDFDKASISFFDFAGEAIMRPTGQNHKDKSSHGTEREFGGTLGETLAITSSLYIRGWIINLSRHFNKLCHVWTLVLTLSFPTALPMPLCHKGNVYLLAITFSWWCYMFLFFLGIQSRELSVHELVIFLTLRTILHIFLEELTAMNPLIHGNSCFQDICHIHGRKKDNVCLLFSHSW